MSDSTHIVDFEARGKDHDIALYGHGPVSDNVDMAKDPENHLKAWRKFRKLTQQELADRVDPPTTKQVIQALESGFRGLSDKWLRRLAPALGTTPGFLLDHHPDELDNDILSLWADVPEERREEGRAMLEILAKKRA